MSTPCVVQSRKLRMHAAGMSKVGWQGRAGNLSDQLRNGFQQLAAPLLDLPGSQVRISCWFRQHVA